MFLTQVMKLVTPEELTQVIVGIGIDLLVVGGVKESLIPLVIFPAANCVESGHSVMSYWHKFDENFAPPTTPNAQSSQATTSGQDVTEGASQSSQTIAIMANTNQPSAFTQEYSLPLYLESQAWFADSGALHHLTTHEFYLYNKKSYLGSNKVFMGNGKTLEI